MINDDRTAAAPIRDRDHGTLDRCPIQGRQLMEPERRTADELKALLLTIDERILWTNRLLVVIAFLVAGITSKACGWPD